MIPCLRAAALVFICLAGTLPARGDGIPTDNASRQRGVSVALQVCSACHDIKYVKYRHLKALGFSDDELDALRGDHALSDPLLSLMPAADRKAMYGLVPPDLSLMAEARRGKAQYIYDVLTAFYVTADGTIDNLVFPGIRMPDILGISTAAGDPELRKELEGQARDVAAFLAWAADPSVDERRRLAPYVLGYLALITLLLYLLKRRTWARFRNKPVEFE
jgi:ubiquinol-cytochrome c reductase cytochrome c1 subunit